MKKFLRIFVCVWVAVFLSCFDAGPAIAEQNFYMVSADIAAATETPGMAYEREGSAILYSEGLKSALVYGNIVTAEPFDSGEYAEVFGEEGESMGYVDMAALTPLPKVEYFHSPSSAPEPCRFAVDSPLLFLTPGALSILDYTLPDDEPYYVLAGEAADGLGTFKDAAGQEWTLLRFETEGYEFRFRHAWTRSENVTRLSLYEPDHTKIDPALVPGSLRDFGGTGKVEDKFINAILKDGFALDATPVIHDWLWLDDLVESYPDSSLDPVYTPNFVTADLFLHAFHLVFSRALKTIEEDDFAPALENMLAEAVEKLNELERLGKNSVGADANKSTFSKARDFLTVPWALLDTDRLTSERAQEEIDRILKAEGFELSVFSGKDEDYTFYKPRGHYTSSELLSRYFRAMTFLGGTGINPRAGNLERNRENTALIALLCVLFEDESLARQWNDIYEPLACLIGAADDPSFIEYGPVVKNFLNAGLDGLDKLVDPDTLDALSKALLAATPAPKIIDAPAGNVTQEEREAISAGFRLMGRRFMLDAWVFGQLTSPKVGSDTAPRNLPKTADIMAALGSNAADAALEADKRNIPCYADALEKVKKDVHSFFEDWDGTLVSAWLGTLGIYLTDRDSKQFFWNSPLWESKKLLTASASWTELKHDTVLYAKQNYAEMGDGGDWMAEPFRKPTPLGYVEPSPRTFAALGETLSRLREIIVRFGLDADENKWNGMQSRVEALMEYAGMFRAIAEKEVKEERLTLDDYLTISQITSYLNANLLLDSSYAEEEDSDQLKMALVTDVSTDAGAGRVLQAGTGTPRRIYVFVNDKWGGPRVTVGYTYSFYEFPRPLSNGRMTDEDWKKLVYDKTRQDELEKMAPEWTENLYVR